MNKSIKELASKYVKYKLNWSKVDDNTWEAESCYWRDNGEPIMYRIALVEVDDGFLFNNISDSELLDKDVNNTGFLNLEYLMTQLQNDNYENVIAILLEQIISK